MSGDLLLASQVPQGNLVTMMRILINSAGALCAYTLGGKSVFCVFTSAWKTQCFLCFCSPQLSTYNTTDSSSQPPPPPYNPAQAMSSRIEASLGNATHSSASCSSSEWSESSSLAQRSTSTRHPAFCTPTRSCILHPQHSPTGLRASCADVSHEGAASGALGRALVLYCVFGVFLLAGRKHCVFCVFEPEFCGFTT